MADSLLRLEKVCKTYNPGLVNETQVLHDIDLEMQPGEFVALIGPSGSGKSTLLNIMGLLDRPTSGRLIIKGRDTSALSEAEITRLRGQNIGFVFQYHMLISAFTAVENVEMPMLVDRGFPNAQMQARAEELIALAAASAPFGGLYATHMRSEGDGIDAALDEAFRIPGDYGY